MSSFIFAFNLFSISKRLASIFLNCFYFSMSLFFCCSERPVQNSASFCLSTSRVRASSAFFQVSSSQTTWCSSWLSYNLFWSSMPPPYFYEGRTFLLNWYSSLGSAIGISSSSIKFLISNPFCLRRLTGPRSSKYEIVLSVPIFFKGLSEPSTSSTGSHAS